MDTQPKENQQEKTEKVYKPLSIKVTNARIQAFLAEYSELTHRYGFTMTPSLSLVPLEVAPQQGIMANIPVLQTNKEEYGDNLPDDSASDCDIDLTKAESVEEHILDCPITGDQEGEKCGPCHTEYVPEDQDS